MATTLAIVALLLIAGYSVWMVVSGIRDARAERPRQTFWQSVSRGRGGWGQTVIVFGFTAVLLTALTALIAITQFPVLLALTGVERFTFPIALAAFAALFFGARLLFQRYLGKRWVRELIALGSVVIGLGLVFFALSFLE